VEVNRGTDGKSNQEFLRSFCTFLSSLRSFPQPALLLLKVYFLHMN